MLRVGRVVRRSRRQSAVQAKRCYNFGTAQYASGAAREWWTDPARSIKGGCELKGAVTVPTNDAFGVENGASVLSDVAEIRAIAEHARAMSAKYAFLSEDFPAMDAVRTACRAAEERLFALDGALAPQLVANQARDFHKQDGVTELEEAWEAAPIERLYNDMLLEDERNGLVTIDRSVALVCCVSNFSNFLDLSRKTLRNLELGIPVIVLSRQNMGQHVYRWARLLAQELDTSKELLSFANCDLETQQLLMREMGDATCHVTGSRETARAIRTAAPELRVFASTGGPNTMILCAEDALSIESFAKATRDSAFIEHSGQCTALRHVVAPGVAEMDPRAIASALASPSTNSVDALENGEFASLLAEAPAAPLDDYESEGAVAWRVHDNVLPPRVALEEHWRRVVLDLASCASREELFGREQRLAAWLVEQQPISCVVNTLGQDPEGLKFARRLWEASSQVVFSVGDVEQPALTAQARPQDAEIFGEVPPRRTLNDHTVSPVIVPSSTPSYTATYTEASLILRATQKEEEDPLVAGILAGCSLLTRGYCGLLLDFLREQGPREGRGRASLWGLQRPPLGRLCFLRVEANDTMDSIAPALVAFLSTTAASSLRVSGDHELAELLPNVVVQTAYEFEVSCIEENPWNVLRAGDHCGAKKSSGGEGYALVGHFAARLFVMGHVKSTRETDGAFIKEFKNSEKWLRSTVTH